MDMQYSFHSIGRARGRGLKTFMDPGCSGCHYGAPVGGQVYDKFGVTGPYWKLTSSKKIDEGRFAVTHNRADMYVFKVPPLRNVRMTAPYFHDGSVATLEEAVPIMAKLQLGKTLDASQVARVVGFLDAPDGRHPHGRAAGSRGSAQPLTGAERIPLELEIGAHRHGAMLLPAADGCPEVRGPRVFD
jgi:cytochrome c peroxidase